MKFLGIEGCYPIIVSIFVNGKVLPSQIISIMAIGLNIKKNIRPAQAFAFMMLAFMAFLPQKLMAVNPKMTYTGHGCKGDTLKLDASTGVTKIVWKQGTTTIKTTNYTPTALGYGITVAGNKEGYSGSGPMYLNYPYGMCLDAAGNVYVADYSNNRIQKWAPSATYGITVAGSGAGDAGSDSMHLSNPADVYVDASGNIYVADFNNNRIQKWAPGATYGITVAGSESGASGSDAYHFDGPDGIVLDANNNMYVTDQNNNRVQKWASGANYGTTLASNLNYPDKLCLDANNNLYISNTHDNNIQEWKPGASSGITVAGDASGSSGTSSSLLWNPEGVYVDECGNLFVGDNFNDRVQKYSPGAGSGVTVAGDKNGNSGSDSLHLYHTAAVVLDKYGDIYVLDILNNRVQKYSYSPDVKDYLVINTSGNYYAIVTYVSCDVVNSDTVSINIATADAGSNTSICTGSSVALGSTAISGHAYSWVSDPSGFTSTSSNPTVSPTITTTYTLTESNTNAGCPDSNSVVVTVNSKPAPPIISADTLICAGNILQLLADYAAGASYHWSGPDNFSSKLQNPGIANVQAVNSGIYSATISENGCTSDTSILKVDVIPIPDANWTVTIYKLRAAFAANDNYAKKFAWNFGDGNIDSTQIPIHTYGSDGIYLVKLVVTGQDGCTNEYDSTIVIDTLTVLNTNLNFKVYPNPFANNITITYYLATTQNVKIILNDALGKLITVFVNENQPAGNYTYTIDGDRYSLAAGVYFLHFISASEAIEVKIVRVK